MNFKYINKLFLVLIFFVVYSCQNLENITKKENAKKTEIINNEKYETSDSLSLKNNFETNNTIIDFYINILSNNFKIDETISKKLTINNYDTNYDGSQALKLYIMEDFIYGVDSKSNFNIYNLIDGKLVNSVKLVNTNDKNIFFPTSIVKYQNTFIIGFKSGRIIKVDKDGKLLWDIYYDKILSTPLKIFNDNLIVLYGDTIKSLLIENGNENWSETYEGLPIFQIKGGSIKTFANLLYFILPNSYVGEFDTLFKEKNYTGFSDIKFQNSINNSYDDIHVFDNYVVYFDESNHLYTYDIFLNEFLLNDFNISNVSSFVFFNNSLIVQNNDILRAYNLKNGNIFWSINIEKTINKKNKIIKVESFNNNLYVFFDNGKIHIIQNGEIINTIDLKVKNINLLYFQDDKIFVSLENGKTVLF